MEFLGFFQRHIVTVSEMISEMTSPSSELASSKQRFADAHRARASS